MLRMIIVFLLGIILMGKSVMAEEVKGVLSQEDFTYVQELTAAVLEASRVYPDAKVGGIGPNTTGEILIRPGGRKAYPAFWIRDYAMSLDMGLITLKEQQHMLFLTAENQVDALTKLKSGSILPPGSIADHITFKGVPIFFPGTLEDAENQGGERWGYLPSLDDHFYFVHMAREYARQSGKSAFLDEAVRGKSLYQRLEEAYAMPPSRKETGLVYSEEEKRGVNFGFFDTTTHTGELFFCSLLKFQAAQALAELAALREDADKAQRYAAEAEKIRQAAEAAFADASGWFRASTGLSAQYDVWGTAFAVYLGALSPEREAMACQVLLKAYRKGTIAWEGAIRHVPTDADFSAESAWEKSLAKKNTYQNGAYWNTSVGWVVYALCQVDQAAARQLAKEYVAQIKQDDFRKGPEAGSPWECRHEVNGHQQNPVYLTSVSCPLAAFMRLRQ